MHDLPDGYHDQVREQLRTVDVASVDAAAREHLRVDELVTVVVGDAGAFRDELGRGLDLPVVTVAAQRD